MASLKKETRNGARSRALEALRFDIDRHKLDLREWQRLKQEVLRISDREQRRIGQDLHDGLGQQLAGLWCAAEALRKNLAARSSPEAAAAAKISCSLHDLLDQTRGLARGLHPVPTGPDGLMCALRDLAASVSALAGISCRFNCSRPVMVKSNSDATHLYRIAQEAVANALKHGRARKIDITLSLQAKQFVLSVRNNGAALPAAPRGRLGWSTMNYRADLVGGRIQMRNRPEGGTELSCVVDGPAGHQGGMYAKTKAAGTRRREKNIYS